MKRRVTTDVVLIRSKLQIASQIPKICKFQIYLSFLPISIILYRCKYKTGKDS